MHFCLRRIDSIPRMVPAAAIQKLSKASIIISAITTSILIGSAVSGAEPTADGRASAIHFGRVLGAAGTCVFIPGPRIAAASAKIKDMLAKFNTAHPDMPDLLPASDQGVGEGKSLVPLKKTNCAFVENDLSDVEHMAALWLPGTAPVAPKP
jgi:hypothetical protein